MSKLKRNRRVMSPSDFTREDVTAIEQAQIPVETARFDYKIEQQRSLAQQPSKRRL
jgi:hypothetical protein